MGFEPVSLLLAIVILGFLIAIHELGHMLVAKRVGMRVLRFSIGFGPVLWKRTWGETTYQLAAIPIGGFVEVDGMNPLEENADPDDPRLFENKSVWARTAMIFAGPLTNYLFAFLFAGIVYASLGTAFRASKVDRAYDLSIEEVTKGQAADKAGLLAGDVVTHVDGYPLKNLNSYYDVIALQRAGYRYEPDPKRRADLMQFRVKVRRGTAELEVACPLQPKVPLAQLLKLRALPKGGGVLVEQVDPRARGVEVKPGDVVIGVGDRPVRQVGDLAEPAAFAKEGFRFAGKDRWVITLWIKRKGAHFQREVKPDEQTGMIGVRFANPIVWVRQGFWKDLKAGLHYPIFISEQMLSNLAKLVRFDKETAASARGPVGIVKEVQQQLKAGVSDSLIIVILLSVLLGLFNLLPIPALDGGRIVFRLLEIVTRFRMSPLREARVHSYGLWVLLILMLVLTVRDVQGCFGF